MRWYGLNSQYDVTVKMAKRYYCLLYIVCIGSDRPLLRDLHNYVVMEAAHKWRDLGLQLLENYQLEMLNIIAADYPDDVRRCLRVLDRWLETIIDASWNQLIRALRSPSVQLDPLADQLEQMIGIKCKIYSNTVATHCVLLLSALIIVQQVWHYSKIPFVCIHIRVYIYIYVYMSTKFPYCQLWLIVLLLVPSFVLHRKLNLPVMSLHTSYCWQYNNDMFAYNKCVVSRDSNLASLLGAFTITNLFPIQHKFM